MIERSCTVLNCLLSKYFSGIERLTPNVAPKSTATQSSRYTSNSYAYLAIDENFSTVPIDCATTKNEYAAWWQVDLLDIYEVSKVAITGKRAYRECFANDSFGICAKFVVKVI